MKSMNALLYIIIVTVLFLSLCRSVEPEIKQYNFVAKKYSDMVVEGNSDSITAYFRHLAIPFEGRRVLDLGCGDGYDLSQIKLRGALIYGIDASEEMIKLAQEKNPDGIIELGYFDKIPFQEQFFDIVISKWALQIAADLDPIYREIARVIKPNGQLIFLSAHPIRQFMDKKFEHKDYFKQELVEAIFFDGELREIAPSHTMNEYLSPTFFSYFILEAYEEGYDKTVEKVNGDTYPSYFIIKARARGAD
jgi:ubiquinone/menaquinone biosynthesis C-methylase UbiE